MGKRTKQTKQTQRWNAKGGYLEKRCGRCGEWKPATAEYFIRNKNTASGLASRCKACNNAVNKAWREENPEYFKTWKAENAERVAELAEAYREQKRVTLRKKSQEYKARRICS